jgi:hypothetical protein
MTSARRDAVSLLSSERAWVVVAGLALVVIVAVSQNRVVGWEPGYNELQPGHHGWVSSHTLAVIAHATPANGFVGYARAFLDEDGRLDFDYFDRYPVYFSAGMNALLSLKPRLSTQVFLAKQAMNGFFLLTMLAAYLLLRKLALRPLPALVATVLAVSSPYLLFYKDMVHFDQPALFGMLLLILAIAVNKVDGKRAAVFLATLAATSLGRGYASLVILAVWFSLEAIAALRRRGLPWPSRLAGLFSLTAFRALLLGVAWAALNLGYNISIEASRRGLPALHTSIVSSAVNRLALSQEFNASYADLLAWRYFISDELIRLVRWSFPVWNYEGSWLVSAGIVALMIAVIFLFARTLDGPRRMVVTILVLSGPIWITLMRNLSAFHDYTAMYFLGIPLAFLASAVSLIRLPRLGWILALILSLAVFSTRNAQIQDLHREIGAATSSYTHDFMRIAAALPAQGQTIYLADGVPDAPYAFGFYLPGQIQAPLEHAEYSIVRRPESGSANLTPDNAHLFLVENN